VFKSFFIYKILVHPKKSKKSKDIFWGFKSARIGQNWESVHPIWEWTTPRGWLMKRWWLGWSADVDIGPSSLIICRSIIIGWPMKGKWSGQRPSQSKEIHYWPSTMAKVLVALRSFLAEDFSLFLRLALFTL
jgi:hypothetical protein